MGVVTANTAERKLSLGDGRRLGGDGRAAADLESSSREEPISSGTNAVGEAAGRNGNSSIVSFGPI